MKGSMMESPSEQKKPKIQWKFIIAGALIIGAILFLILSSTKANAQYFLTVDELNEKGSSLIGKDVKVSGAIVGDTINFDANALHLSFEIANIPGSNAEIEAKGGLAQVLHDASVDPSARRLKIVYEGPKPDLMRNEAQAIVTGKMESDGVFHATELLLKCPTKYEEAVPSQVVQ
jgi:cytochrome c-type biogenesis protein CcmE